MEPLCEDVAFLQSLSLHSGTESMKEHAMVDPEVLNPIYRRDAAHYFRQVYVCSFSGALLLLCHGCFSSFFFSDGVFFFLLILYLPDMNRCQRQVRVLILYFILTDHLDIWHS